MMFKFIHLFFLDWELSYIVPMSVVFTFFREHTLLAAVPASLRQEFILHCALPTLVLSDYRLASQWTWHLPHTRRYIQWTHTGSHSWKPSNKPLFRRFQIFLDHFPCYRDISWYPWWGMRAIRRKPNRRNRVLLNHYDDLWWCIPEQWHLRRTNGRQLVATWREKTLTSLKSPTLLKVSLRVSKVSFFRFELYTGLSIN